MYVSNDSAHKFFNQWRHVVFSWICIFQYSWDSRMMPLVKTIVGGVARYLHRADLSLVNIAENGPTRCYGDGGDLMGLHVTTVA